MAATTASRFVFAPVCLMASRSDFSGISIVVFMLLQYLFLESSQGLMGFPNWDSLNLQERHVCLRPRHDTFALCGHQAESPRAEVNRLARAFNTEGAFHHTQNSHPPRRQNQLIARSPLPQTNLEELVPHQVPNCARMAGDFRSWEQRRL